MGLKKREKETNFLILEGDHIKVTASRFPFPTVCKDDQATDWFNSLQNCLHWNKRERQKSFAVVESHSTKSKSSRSNSHSHLPSLTPPRNGLAPLSRHEHTPPSSNTRKSSSSSSSVTSSDAGQDEVFGMFYDDDGRQKHRNGSRRNSHRRSSSVEDNSSISSLDSFESDEESDSDISTPDAFTGWSDEEIIKAKYMAHITKELERTALKTDTI